MNFTRRNYLNAAKNRRERRKLTRKLKRLGGPLHRNNNNANVGSNNWPNNYRNRPRRAGLNSPTSNSMRLNNWGNTPKSTE